MAELADFVLPHTEERHAAYVEGELEQLLGELSESELRALLAELESPAAEPDPGGAHP